MAEGKLFLLKNNGALHAIDKRTGKVLLEAQARRARRLLARLRQRAHLRARCSRAGKKQPGAVSRWTPRRARSSGSGCCRRARSPRRCSTTTASTSAPRTAPSTRCAPATARCAGRSRPPARSRAALALANGKLFFGDYSGRVYAIRQADGGQVWATGTKGAQFGLRSGQFYSTPAVAYGRVYIGNTDGKMYSFASDNGKLAWTKGTGGLRLRLARRRAGAGREADRLLRLLRRQLLRARRPHRQDPLAAQLGGKISGGATVVGDIVYFSNYGKKDTTGLGARTGREVFHMGRGAFNPVISDGRTIFLTGYSSLYALRPAVAIARKPAAQASLTSGIGTSRSGRSRRRRTASAPACRPSTRCCGVADAA